LHSGRCEQGNLAAQMCKVVGDITGTAAAGKLLTVQFQVE